MPGKLAVRGRVELHRLHHPRNAGRPHAIRTSVCKRISEQGRHRLEQLRHEGVASGDGLGIEDRAVADGRLAIAPASVDLEFQVHVKTTGLAFQKNFIKVPAVGRVL